MTKTKAEFYREVLKINFYQNFEGKKKLDQIANRGNM